MALLAKHHQHSPAWLVIQRTRTHVARFIVRADSALAAIGTLADSARRVTAHHLHDNHVLRMRNGELVRLADFHLSTCATVTGLHGGGRRVVQLSDVAQPMPVPHANASHAVGISGAPLCGAPAAGARTATDHAPTCTICAMVQHWNGGDHA